jgi:hypothetical protein
MMALVDVTQLLTDPDFTDTVQLIRRTKTVNTYGEGVLTEAAGVNATMVVQPATGDDLKKTSESAILTEYIKVWFKGDLNLQTVNGYSDIIVHRGRRFECYAPDDFSNYGAGYTSAICILENHNA